MGHLLTVLVGIVVVVAWFGIDGFSGRIKKSEAKVGVMWNLEHIKIVDRALHVNSPMLAVIDFGKLITSHRAVELKHSAREIIFPWMDSERVCWCNGTW